MTSSKRSSILLIYTGGTIGMKKDPVTGTLKPFDLSQILQAVPELGRFDIELDHYTFDPLIDSSDVEPSMWQKLAGIIRDRYDSYDGFVILHGTDTMAYSASALSFMLDGLDKSIVFTGSQLPIGEPRTDGRENLVSAVEIAAAKDAGGRSRVPEVTIFFDSTLIRGNRAVKINSAAFDAFSSPNFPQLADAGIGIRYYDLIIRKPEPGTDFQIHTELDTRVSILKLHPGITAQVVRNILLGPETRAVIIETYGSGNACSRDWFLDIVREAGKMGKILLNVTQCACGEVNMNLYATGSSLKEAGVVSGHDLTTESALSKLFVLMGMYSDNDVVRHLLEENLRGEISK